MINPVWLRSFCTLVEIGHFTRTAERLNMTQSGVSQHIKKLEDHISTSLIARQDKSFQLTDTGKRFYRDAREILRALERLEQQASDDPDYEGLVRIMSPGSVGLKLYPQLLSLQQQHPALVMDYRFAPNADIEKAVQENRIDLGLMTSRTDNSGLSCHTLAQEKLLLVTHTEQESISFARLMELGFIDHPDGAHHAGLLISANYPEFQNISQFPKRGFSNQINLILEPVSRGLGFSVLPAHAVAAYPHQDKIKTHTLTTDVAETLYLVKNQNQPTPNRVKTVIEALKSWL